MGYFAPARADQGAPGFLDDHTAPVATWRSTLARSRCTRLIDQTDPAFPPNTWSCPSTKHSLAATSIRAYPVVGATQYHFQFENVGEGYLRNIFKPSYLCHLSWSPTRWWMAPATPCA